VPLYRMLYIGILLGIDDRSLTPSAVAPGARTVRWRTCGGLGPCGVLYHGANGQGCLASSTGMSQCHTRAWGGAATCGMVCAAMCCDSPAMCRGRLGDGVTTAAGGAHGT
jgi:hypothetical protein